MDCCLIILYPGRDTLILSKPIRINISFQHIQSYKTYRDFLQPYWSVSSVLMTMSNLGWGGGKLIYLMERFYRSNAYILPCKFLFNKGQIMLTVDIETISFLKSPEVSHMMSFSKSRLYTERSTITYLIYHTLLVQCPCLPMIMLANIFFFF